jgi:ABC-2 type transport system permease protein
MTAALLAMSNETRKGLAIFWDYKFSILVELLGIGMVFTGVVFFVGRGELAQADLQSSLLGFLITSYAIVMVSQMSWNLTNEAQTGTLEQMYMSPIPSGLLIFGRTIATLITGTIELLIVATALILALNIHIAFDWQMIPVLLITLIGLAGFGYMVAGATIVFKQVGPLANIVENLLLFINGTFLPVDYMPGWLATIARIYPTTQGIIVLRQIALDGLSLHEVWTDGSLILLIAHSLVFLILGWLVFVWCERVARRRGTLGQY